MKALLWITVFSELSFSYPI